MCLLEAKMETIALFQTEASAALGLNVFLGHLGVSQN